MNNPAKSKTRQPLAEAIDITTAADITAPATTSSRARYELRRTLWCVVNQKHDRRAKHGVRAVAEIPAGTLLRVLYAAGGGEPPLVLTDDPAEQWDECTERALLAASVAVAPSNVDELLLALGWSVPPAVARSLRWLHAHGCLTLEALSRAYDAA